MTPEDLARRLIEDQYQDGRIDMRAETIFTDPEWESAKEFYVSLATTAIKALSGTEH